MLTASLPLAPDPGAMRAAVAPAGAAAALVALMPGIASGCPAAAAAVPAAGVTGDKGPLAPLLTSAEAMLDPPNAAAAPPSRWAKGLAPMSATGAVSSDPNARCCLTPRPGAVAGAGVAAADPADGAPICERSCTICSQLSRPASSSLLCRALPALGGPQAPGCAFDPSLLTSTARGVSSGMTGVSQGACEGPGCIAGTLGEPVACWAVGARHARSRWSKGSMGG